MKINVIIILSSSQTSLFGFTSINVCTLATKHSLLYSLESPLHWMRRKKSLFTTSNISPGWQKNENVWKRLKGIRVNGFPWKVPWTKSLGLWPLGFGLGTSQGTSFPMIPRQHFHILSHPKDLIAELHISVLCKTYWYILFCKQSTNVKQPV